MTKATLLAETPDIWFGLVTLFPAMCDALQQGVTGRALKENKIALTCSNPRDFATDKHKTVDDHPYGGGPGMVMMPGPLQSAIHDLKNKAPHPARVIYLSPQGKKFDQAAAEHFAKEKALIFIAGRYEGVDERVIMQEVDEEWSIGDYILTGGELAALVMVDAITRLLPGVVGDDESIKQDSLTTGLLKYPQYTRPESFAGLQVPDVVLSGHHQQIQRWRLKVSLGKTYLRRPDLLAQRNLTAEEKLLLEEFVQDLSLKKS